MSREDDDQKRKDECMNVMREEGEKFYQALRKLCQNGECVHPINATMNVLNSLVAQLIEIMEDASPGMGDKAEKLFTNALKQARPIVAELLRTQGRGSLH